MAFLYDVPEYKKIRVIIDTDAACEADDPFAIVQALLSPKLIVKGILAEHFNAPGSMEQSYQEILTILECMGMEKGLALRGQEGPICLKERGEWKGEASEKESSEERIVTANVTELSEGVRFLIEEAMKEDEKPLFVLCQGAITNVAAAMQARPEIIHRMTVIWIGTHGEAPHRAPFREFNAGNDVTAANLVLSCGGDVWIVPSTVYTTILIGIAEIQKRILPCGKIGEHLFWNLVNYNNSEGAGWTKGESWSLGDSPAIALALNPDCGHFHYVPAPVVSEDTSSIAWMPENDASSTHTENVKGQQEFSAEKKEAAQDGNPDARPMVKMYTDVDSRYILEDLIAKLELFCEL